MMRGPGRVCAVKGCTVDIVPQDDQLWAARLLHRTCCHHLRTCPDCGWVFYDSGRNARRTWCSMTAADGARGCGSIAKTRAYRARRAAGRSR